MRLDRSQNVRHLRPGDLASSTRRSSFIVQGGFLAESEGLSYINRNNRDSSDLNLNIFVSLLDLECDESNAWECIILVHRVGDDVTDLIDHGIWSLHQGQ